MHTNIKTNQDIFFWVLCWLQSKYPHCQLTVSSHDPAVFRHTVRPASGSRILFAKHCQEVRLQPCQGQSCSVAVCMCMFTVGIDMCRAIDICVCAYTYAYVCVCIWLCVHVCRAKCVCERVNVQASEYTKLMPPLPPLFLFSARWYSAITAHGSVYVGVTERRCVAACRVRVWSSGRENGPQTRPK